LKSRGAIGFFIAEFYESLASGYNASEAMARARKRCQDDPIFNQPLHWGAFVLVGDNQILLPLEKKSESNPVSPLEILLAFLAIGIAVPVYLTFKKNGK